MIHCSRIRRAWRDSAVGRQLCADQRITEYPIDEPASFVRFLAARAAAVNPAGPNIAILRFASVWLTDVGVCGTESELSH